MTLAVDYVPQCEPTTGVVSDAKAAKQCSCRWTKYINSLQMGQIQKPRSRRISKTVAVCDKRSGSLNARRCYESHLLGFLFQGRHFFCFDFPGRQRCAGKVGPKRDDHTSRSGISLLGLKVIP